jgi:uncharacterized protein (DUF2147 family)
VLRNCRLFFIVLLSSFPLNGFDPSPEGVWRTIDDNTHKPRGLVRVYEQDGAVFGKVEASLDPKEANQVCERCSGDRKNKLVVGMVVMWNMKKRGAEYAGGDILDPDTGQVYRCKFTLEDGGRKLVVRGFIGISLLGRSQTWLRQE